MIWDMYSWFLFFAKKYQKKSDIHSELGLRGRKRRNNFSNKKVSNIKVNVSVWIICLNKLNNSIWFFYLSNGLMKKNTKKSSQVLLTDRTNTTEKNNNKAKNTMQRMNAYDILMCGSCKSFAKQHVIKTLNNVLVCYSFFQYTIEITPAFISLFS